MFNRFDILKKLVDGGIVWIEAVSDLETARARIELFAAQRPGEYVVFSQERQALIELPWVAYTRGEKKLGTAKEIAEKTRVDVKTVRTVAEIVADVRRRAARK